MARVKLGAQTETAQPALIEEPKKPEGTTAPAPDPEREAIQAEAKEADDAVARAIAAKQNAALEATKARLMAQEAARPAGPPPDDERAKALGGILGPKNGAAELAALLASDDADIGEPVEAVHGEEMYGKQGTFSSYRVGPFTSSTKIRKGETRASATRRLLEELEEIAKIERVRAHAAWAAHFTTNFGSKPV
jgi:hypothetical protein